MFNHFPATVNYDGLLPKGAALSAIGVTTFGADPTGVKDSTVAVQSAISFLSLGGTVYFPRGTYLLGSLTVSNANVHFELEPGTVLSFPTLGASTYAIYVTANNFSIEDGTLQGPASGAYVSDEFGIYMLGTSTSNRLSGLRVSGTEFKNFGSDGLRAKFVDDIWLDNHNIHDCGFAGALFISCNHGKAVKGRIKTITPGTAGNMYGISLTNVSTGYVGGGKAATNPFCWDWYIGSHTIEDIDWEGIDGHGGYEVVIDSNNVYNTKLGISSATGSGDAANYAGWSNRVVNNLVDARNSDGTASGRENTGYGINVNGGSSQNNLNPIVTNNTLIGKGILGNSSSGSIQAVRTANAAILCNTIKSWGGNGILLDSSSNPSVIGNTALELGGAAAGVERFISAASDVPGLTVVGNKMLANGGTAGRIGLSIAAVTTAPNVLSNNFDAATVSPYIFSANNLLSHGSLMPILSKTVNNAGGGETVSIATMINTDIFILNITSSDAASVITNLTGGRQGQTAILYSPSATAWTFDLSNAELAGLEAFVAGQYDTLTLFYTGVIWIEISRSINSAASVTPEPSISRTFMLMGA